MASAQLTHPGYRADIDGLRAIAVLAIVGFHAFPSAVPGGYVGVDVFFVISGFLISTLLLGSLQRERFSLIDFYRRRVRRIFPSLLLILAVCFVFGWLALTPDAFKQLGKHIAGGSILVSNFVLWSESGYFDNAADTKPLLHLWSLGIEEQFYLIWPLLLWVTWKKKLNLLAVTCVLVVISFVINVANIRTNAVSSFYLPQARFWELSCGSVLAVMALAPAGQLDTIKPTVEDFLGRAVTKLAPHSNSNIASNIQSLIGITLIAVSILFLNEKSRFPGWLAVLPTAGTVLIVSAGTVAWLNDKILSSRVLVGVGLVSYPLYLWHWPILSFMRIVANETPSVELRLAAVVVSLVLAWTTYRLVERPIRFGANLNLKSVALVLLMVVAGFAGYDVYLRDGYSARPWVNIYVMNEGDTGGVEFYQYQVEKFFLCTPEAIRNDKPFYGLPGVVRCLQSKPEGQPIDMAIIGDSHAEHLFLGLADAFPNRNVVYYLKMPNPMMLYHEYDEIFKYVISNQHIKTVILAGYWSFPPNASLSKNLAKSLGETAASLAAANKAVYIFDDVPNFSLSAEKCKFSSGSLFITNICTEDSSKFDQRHRAYDSVFKDIPTTNAKIKFISTAQYFCDSKICRMAIDGSLLYRDDHHLNINGSKFVAQKVISDNPGFPD